MARRVRCINCNQLFDEATSLSVLASATLSRTGSSYRFKPGCRNCYEPGEPFKGAKLKTRRVGPVVTQAMTDTEGSPDAGA